MLIGINEKAGANGARKTVDVVRADALRGNDAQAAPEAAEQHDQREEDRRRGGNAGQRPDADIPDRNRVNDAEQLIAEHLHGKRQR